MVAVPVQRRTADAVYAYVRDQIASGELSAGSRLDLDEVARALGVSRTPVREAVLRLEGDGFLQRDPYRAAIVTSIDASYVEETVALRVHTEGLAARLGCQRLSPEDIDEMRRHFRELEQVDHVADHAEFARLNAEFHGVLYRATNAPRLLAIIDTLGRHAERIRLHYQITRNVHVAEQHQAILDACTGRDPAEAQRAMRHHILGVLVEMTRDSDLSLSPDGLQYLPAVLSDEERSEFLEAVSHTTARRAAV